MGKEQNETMINKYRHLQAAGLLVEIPDYMRNNNSTAANNVTLATDGNSCFMGRINMVAAQRTDDVGLLSYSSALF